MTNMRTYRILETLGGFVIFLLATFLHFFYKLSGGSIIGALFGSVNESVWEHIKIFCEAYLAFTLIEILWARPAIRKLIPAKAAGLLVLSTGITLCHYFAVWVLGRESFLLDIIIGIAFSFLAHLTSYKLTTLQKNHGQFFFTGLFFIILVLIMLLCFTFFPPQLSVFMDKTTEFYGLPRNLPL